MFRNGTIAFLLISSWQSIVFAQAPNSPSYIVIVNPKNMVQSVDRKFLLETYLKKITRWKDNEVIRPVDLKPDSPVRNKFSEEVLKRTKAEVKNYWLQKIFTGNDLPPPEMDKDTQVVQYVLKHPGAIGYVSGNADVNGVKVLTVE